MTLDYRLAYVRPAQNAKKHRKHADNLSFENPGDPFAGTATALVCQFSAGSGGRHWPQSGRSGAVGIAGSQRTTFAAPDRSATDRQAPKSQKTRCLND